MKFIRKWAVAALVGSLMIGCRDGERNAASEGTSGANDNTAAAGASDPAGTTDGAAAGAASRSAAAGSGNGASSGSAELRTGAVESATAERVVLFLGTSLTAGLGVPIERSFPMVVEERIEAAGLRFRVVNAGVSGETSAGALRRIDWLLRQPFDVLVLETGANDMLRGTDPASTEQNIQTIVDRVRTARPQARIVLAGMRAAPNLGLQYVARFEAIYPRVAERNRLVLIPFLLEGVAAVPSLNQGDGIHPNEAGHRKAAENVWKDLEPVLRQAGD